MRRALPLIALTILAGAAAAAQVAAPAPVSLLQPDRRVLVTELLSSLDSARTAAGAPVLLRTVTEWTSLDCVLRAGSTVSGHVVSVVRHTKTSPDGEMQLIFTAAECNARPSAKKDFTVVALIASEEDRPRDSEGEAPPLANYPLALGAGGAQRSPTQGLEFTNYSSLVTRRLPPVLKPGTVVDLKRVSLSAVTSPEGASVVRGTGRDLRLNRSTLVLLVPRALPVPRAQPTPAAAPTPTAAGIPTPIAGAPDAGNPPPSSVEIPDETEICSDACNELTSSSPETTEPAAIAGSVPIRALGFSPRDQHPVPGFNDETTLTFLDDHHLLCTFDPHAMRTRNGAEDETTRTIRAVLIDPATYAVRRVVSWRVRGETQYLWRLPGGRVLVHMGHELRTFDAELRTVRSIPLAGPLAWVSVAPSGEHIAIGTVHERHTSEIHQQLAQASASAPEEDTLIRVYDGHGTLLVETERSSKVPVPVFSDLGELRVHALGHGRWQLQEYRWDQTQHLFATTRSTCRPVLSTPAPDLVFAIGCAESIGHWYRMLRLDGHPLLKAQSPSNEIEQAAQADTGGTFAVRVVKGRQELSKGRPFDRASLKQEDISVFRSADGTRLSTVSTPDFAFSQLAYTLSPAGDRLALVGTGAIQFYNIGRR